jgi:hypothetical protein
LKENNDNNILFYFYWFQPSLRIAIGTNGDVLEAWMLLEKYITFYTYS